MIRVVINGLAAIKIVFSKPTVEAKICRSTLVTSHWVILMETALAKAAKSPKRRAVSQLFWQNRLSVVSQLHKAVQLAKRKMLTERNIFWPKMLPLAAPIAAATLVRARIKL